ncbi:MAG: magnesium/cobalt transporter CorA [Candidatus Omnitrophota bacterium]
MLKILYLDSNKNFKENLSKQEIVNALEDKKGTFWIDMDKPTEQELGLLSEVFNFHPLAIEECSQYTDLPKIDEFEDHVFIIVHGTWYESNSDEIKRPELDIFMGKNYVVTVHLDIIKTLITNMEKYSKSPQLLAKGSDFLLYNIIDSLVDNYFPLLDYWDDKIDELEDEVLKNNSKDIMSRLIDIKRKMLGLKRSIAPQRDVINKLARRDSPIISAKNVVYFRDVYDHIVRMHELLEANRELLTSIFEAYLSSVSNRMNEIMKRLTIVATIFMPLTLIAGIYGMNFNTQASTLNMPELNWRYGYVFVILLMVFITVGMILYFKKRKWI